MEVGDDVETVVIEPVELPVPKVSPEADPGPEEELAKCPVQ